jgi:hypothetical protein
MLLENMVIQLAEGKPLTLRDARGAYIECTEGFVWLTVEGLADDFLLCKGERLRIVNNGLTLIQGMPSGSIRLSRKNACTIYQASRFAWHTDFHAVYFVA